MTQFFASKTPAAEKRFFSDGSMPSPSASSTATNPSTHKPPGSTFPARVKNFFRINSSHHASHTNLPASAGGAAAQPTPPPAKAPTDGSGGGGGKASAFRQSRLFLGQIGRHRSVTLSGDAAEAAAAASADPRLSPTAQANPYFAHQGPPALRHHGDASVPPSPPGTPGARAARPPGAVDHATTAGKEALARQLRRVASAPNAQGLLFGKGGAAAAGDGAGGPAATPAEDARPATADMGKEPLVQTGDGALAMGDAAAAGGRSTSHAGSPLSSSGGSGGGGGGGSPSLAAAALRLPVPPGEAGSIPSPGQIRNSVAFRRTYSSNSIKVRNVEVGPGSFDKIKLIGKGDVGKVYLVREKKSARLYAMKGEWFELDGAPCGVGGGSCMDEWLICVQFSARRR